MNDYVKENEWHLATRKVTFHHYNARTPRISCSVLYNLHNLFKKKTEVFSENLVI